MVSFMYGKIWLLWNRVKYFIFYLSRVNYHSKRRNVRIIIRKKLCFFFSFSLLKWRRLWTSRSSFCSTVYYFHSLDSHLHWIHSAMSSFDSIRLKFPVLYLYIYLSKYVIIYRWKRRSQSSLERLENWRISINPEET